MFFCLSRLGSRRQSKGTELVADPDPRDVGLCACNSSCVCVHVIRGRGEKKEAEAEKSGSTFACAPPQAERLKRLHSLSFALFA